MDYEIYPVTVGGGADVAMDTAVYNDKDNVTSSFYTQDVRIRRCLTTR